MQTLQIRIPEEVNKKLTALSKQLDRSKSYLIRQAINSYIIEPQDGLFDKGITLSNDDEIK